MTRARRPKERRSAPQGAWLAFLALAVQVLLPFLVAYEIALAGSPAYAATITICRAPGSADAPAKTGEHGARHALNENCPLCAALAAAHGFTVPTPAPAPLPRVPVLLTLRWEAAPLALLPAAASYAPRAPPSIA
jgi:Protein of unknown function (DUF2946)